MNGHDIASRADATSGGVHIGSSRCRPASSAVRATGRVGGPPGTGAESAAVATAAPGRKRRSRSNSK